MSKDHMKLVTLFTIAVILIFFFFFFLAHGARPNPTTLQVRKGESGSCDGIGEEECLARRTLQAHVDYIYTQDAHPPNKSTVTHAP
ncbi:unnamed protein product [Linum trigynum]|uniref:Phytosulfokine n=1 Tax=Linum trigynum TaxID=586398 RepID=A0AAV2CZ17_9ROSI